PVFVFPSIHNPDEVFQTLEQAHRLVFGTGLVPWEFIYGTRSWVLPGALAGLMMLVSPFCAGPNCYIPFIGLVLAALGAASALCAFLGGRRFFGTVGGVIAGIFVAVGSTRSISGRGRSAILSRLTSSSSVFTQIHRAGRKPQPGSERLWREGC